VKENPGASNRSRRRSIEGASELLQPQDAPEVARRGVVDEEVRGGRGLLDGELRQRQGARLGGRRERRPGVHLRGGPRRLPAVVPPAGCGSRRRPPGGDCGVVAVAGPPVRRRRPGPVRRRQKDVVRAQHLGGHLSAGGSAEREGEKGEGARGARSLDVESPAGLRAGLL
jgi:hypothetical protein